MKIKNTKFKDLKVIHGRIFYDKRGSFREIYKNDLFKKNKPLFWCASKSKKNVLRGLHLQKKNSQAKFVSVLKGKILDVVVDLRSNSKTFGKHFKLILSDKNSKSILTKIGFETTLVIIYLIKILIMVNTPSIIGSGKMNLKILKKMNG